MLLLMLTVLGAMFQAQSHRFVYEFKYKSNPASETFSDEIWYLDVIADDVIFMVKDMVWADSVNTVNPYGKSTASHDFPQLKSKKNAVRYDHYYMVNSDYLVYETEDPIKWRLTSDTKIESELKLQKATADFGGRNWTAWFTDSFSLNEGPYKFRGLPGLVVEVSDEQQNFIFKLIRSSELKNPVPDILQRVFRQKPIRITLKKFNEIRLNDFNNPYQQFRNLKPGSWRMSFSDGRTVTTIEELDGMRKEYQDQILNNHNPIELDKAVNYPNK